MPLASRAMPAPQTRHDGKLPAHRAAEQAEFAGAEAASYRPLTRVDV